MKQNGKYKIILKSEKRKNKQTGIGSAHPFDLHFMTMICLSGKTKKLGEGRIENNKKKNPSFSEGKVVTKCFNIDYQNKVEKLFSKT